MAKIKYIRVSTTHQNTDRQEQNAAEFDKVFIDKASGKDTERPEFRKMIDYIREGDVVYFESFSRISRSLKDLLEILELFEAKGVAFVSEKEKVSTEGACGRLVVHILGAISAYEREINAERREYGYRKALEEKRVGRPSKAISSMFEKTVHAWRSGKITATEAMNRLNMPRTSFYRAVKEYGL